MQTCKIRFETSLKAGAFFLLPFIFVCRDRSDTDPAPQAPYDSGRLVVPALFGKGVISTGDFETHPAFTPDGKTLYLVKSSPDFSFWTIYVSHFKDGAWSSPKIAPFSGGKYRDADPFITADGTRLYFISDRPVPGKEKRRLDIWVMTRKGDDWSEPENLSSPVNSDAQEWFPSVTRDGTLYFGSSREGGKGKTDLYRSRFVNGGFTEPENLGEAINSPHDEFEGCIAPDESYLVFMASDRPGGAGDGDLYISFRREGVWTPARNLGPRFNTSGMEISPYIAPNGKYFFFSSTGPLKKHPGGTRPNSPQNGLGDIYQVDISALDQEAPPAK